VVKHKTAQALLREPRTRLFGWRIVLAATIGLAMSPGTVAFYSLGLFIRPISEEFGWSRAEIAFVATILTVSIIVMLPLIGSLIDKYGPRRVLVVSLVLLSLGLMSIVLVDTLWQFYGAFAFIGLAGAGANSPGYIRTLAAWFDKRRGLVIGIASAGMGLGVMLIPPYVHFLAGIGGWRLAYAGIGLAILILGVPCIFHLLRDTPQEMGYAPDGVESVEVRPDSVHEPYGYALKDCVRMRQFWILLLLFTFVGGAINAVAVHLVAMVEDQGSATKVAILAASIFGGAMMIGRLATGWLMDRLFAPVVAAVFFLAAVIGMLFLVMGAAEPWLLLAGMLIGLCAGAEGDVLGFLISRYFGLRSMGSVYSYIFGAYLVGVSLCPFLMGVAYESTGSYVLALVMSISLMLASTALILWLGPYPVFSRTQSAT
jgi:MFS family permease